MKIIFAAIILLLALLQYKLWFQDDGLSTAKTLKQDVSVQKSKNAKLEARNNQLAAEVDALKYGEEATEARARSELGMIKKDEEFYRIVE